MSTNIRNSKILDLISKENQLKSQIALYETINKEYASIGTIDTVQKKNKLNSLITNMTNINNTIKGLAINIKNLRQHLNSYNVKLDNLKLTNENKLNNLIESIKQEIDNLNDIRAKVNDAEGSKAEFSKVYESNNIKYMFWFFVTIILLLTIFSTAFVDTTVNYSIELIIIIVVFMFFFSLFPKPQLLIAGLFILIFRGVFRSEETSLEKFIFILLTIVSVYYIFMYVSNNVNLLNTKQFFNKYKPSML